ncbi:hypothetical protein DB32_007052 [Sandaracinus amylolyticus]|uniref:Lipoprotein n=1 Tax=Sandaracinus amylolyticus TaxID=927083 RepID=A0A0F6YLU2_9BACT|nr:hypothetical protein DB32_007052 [Sandaracinus amylolyticus]
MLLSTLLGLTIASCGNDPENVAGTYTINLTNGPNGCMLDNWEEGDTVTGTTIAVTQDGDAVTVNVEGLAGAYLDVVVGSRQFVGSVDGSHIDARLTGNAGTTGSCAYTFIVDLDADLDGDVLEGTLTWFAQTNGLAECGMYNTCQNTQAFNGTRPPSSGD